MLTANWIRGVIALAALVWALIAFISGEMLEWSWAKSLGLTASIVVWLVLAFDRWLWRSPGIRRLHKQPIMHGTWKTELVTSYPDRKDELIECYLVIDQTYSRICVRTLFDRSQSRSTNAGLVRADGRCVLYYIFRSEKHALEPKSNAPSRGAAELIVASKPSLHLEGDYWMMEAETKGRVKTLGHTRTIYDTYSGAQGGKYK